MPPTNFGDLPGGETRKAKPPVVRFDIDSACGRIWGTRPLASHLGDLERLLMIDADAPLEFDGIPSKPSKSRSVVLVGGVSRAFNANPALLGMMVKRVGGALKMDRLERNGQAIDDAGIEVDVETIKRVVEVNVKPAWRPRA